MCDIFFSNLMGHGAYMVLGVSGGPGEPHLRELSSEPELRPPPPRLGCVLARRLRVVGWVVRVAGLDEG